MGKPVIALGQTGFADVFPKDTFYPIGGTLAPVIPQSFISWYQKGQNWIDIDKEGLSKAMLDVYNNPQEAKEKGKRASEFVKQNLNYHVVGNAMKQRLEEISRFL